MDPSYEAANPEDAEMAGARAFVIPVLRLYQAWFCAL